VVKSEREVTNFLQEILGSTIILLFFALQEEIECWYVNGASCATPDKFNH